MVSMRQIYNVMEAMLSSNSGSKGTLSWDIFCVVWECPGSVLIGMSLRLSGGVLIQPKSLSPQLGGKLVDNCRNKSPKSCCH
jgi:hypothetical protein